MSLPGEQAVLMPSLPNFRDVGGYPTPRGEVRRGLLYRSDQLSDVVDADLAVLGGFGLATVFDLRTAGEAQANPDPVLAGVENVHLDVLADAELAVPANLIGLFSDPDTAATVSAQLATADIGARLADTYRGLVTYDSARAGYRAFFLTLAHDTRPALFHCTAGKDRTGWAAASLLTLLGVERGDVYTDYLLTNDLLVPSFAPVIDRFAAAGGDRSLLEPILGVRAANLDAAFDAVDRTFGSIAGYFTDGLGVDAAAQDRLRERFLH